MVSWALFVVILSLALLVLFYEQKEPAVITIADAEQPGFGLVYIAQKKGYFAQQGLRVNFRKFKFGKDALQDVLAGNSDLATVYETPFVRALYEGKPVAALTSLHYSTKNTWLAADGAKIRAARDLAGRRIATIKGTNLEFFLSEFMITNSLDGRAAVVYVANMDEAMVLLSEGRVDAAVVWNTSPETLSRTLDKEVVRLSLDSYVENSVLIGSSASVAKSDGAIRKLVAALDRAEEFYRENPDEAEVLVSSSIDGSMYWDLDAAWSNITLDLRLDNMLISELEQEAEFFKSSVYKATSVPQFRKHILTKYLRAVSPESVTLF